jgi:hypothetical protein
LIGHGVDRLLVTTFCTEPPQHYAVCQRMTIVRTHPVKTTRREGNATTMRGFFRGCTAIDLPSRGYPTCFVLILDNGMLATAYADSDDPRWLAKTVLSGSRFGSDGRQGWVWVTDAAP